MNDQTYYERNKDKIRQYYLQNQEVLKKKALERYYKRKEERITSGEFIPKKSEYIFKIEHLRGENVTF